MTASVAVDAPQAPAVNPWLIAPLVAMAAFMEIMDISIANVALPHIAGSLGASQDESTWILTSYLVTNAIVMPISGWLANAFGRKRFFLTCIAGFTVASLLCAVAPDLVSLMLLRAVQGAAGGGLQPIGQAILNDSFPPAKRGMATALYGMAAVVAPIMGPVLGGWLTDDYSWRWIFLINVPVGVLLLGAMFSLLTEAPTATKARMSADGWGFMFTALCLGSLQIVMDRGQEDDWFGSSMITLLVIVSALAFVLLIWWELRQEQPMVDVRLLLQREFIIAFIVMAAGLGMVIFSSTFLIPAYAQSLLGYTAFKAGLVIAPAGIVLVILMPIVGQLVNKVDPRLLATVGLLVTGLSSWWMTNFDLDVSFGAMMLARLGQMTGIGFLFVPVNTLAFRSVPSSRINSASALVNLARNLGGSVGLSLASVFLARREQFHQSRLVESLQPLNPAYPDFVQQVNGTSASETLARIYDGALQQSFLLSYLDDFKLLAVLCLLLIPLLFLLKPGKGAAGSVPLH
jgi:DHA2 family multidrug resistance protein